VSADRNKVIEAFHRHIVPLLEARGFSGRFPDFRRIAPDSVHLLSIHFARDRPAYAAEISCAPRTGLPVAGNLVPAEELTAWHVAVSARFRIGPDSPDQWFSFEEPFFSIGDPYKRAVLGIIPYLEKQAELWWKEAASYSHAP
jgi:hypothetical protein